MKVLRRIKKHTKSAIKHFRTHGHKYAGWMFAWFAVVKAFFVIAGFFGLVGLGHTFAQTPADLIAQYYGPTSTYTTNRVSNTCDTSAMQVIEIADNTWRQSLLASSGYALAANTLYVLDSGNYTLYSQLYDNNCTAIIGSGNVQIQAIGIWSSSSLLYANAKQNMIVDNIKLKGEVPGVATSFGINIEGVQSNTISGTEISAVDYGIRINSYSHDNTINNDVVHNINNYGIFIRSYGYNNIITVSYTHLTLPTIYSV